MCCGFMSRADSQTSCPHIVMHKSSDENVQFSLLLRPAFPKSCHGNMDSVRSSSENKGRGVGHKCEDQKQGLQGEIIEV